jgi:hypothetical protein
MQKLLDVRCYGKGYKADRKSIFIDELIYYREESFRNLFKNHG